MLVSDIDPFNLPSLPLERRSQLPATSCIYFAIDSQGVIQYIGQSLNLKQRWSAHNHYKEFKAMGDIKIAYLAYLSVDTPEQLTEIETKLINHFDPPLNLTRDGKNSSTWKSTWQCGKTKSIRVPIIFAPLLINYARAIDRGEISVEDILASIKARSASSRGN